MVVDSKLKVLIVCSCIDYVCFIEELEWRKVLWLIVSVGVGSLECKM